jgi:dienelactone hydrolase
MIKSTCLMALVVAPFALGEAATNGFSTQEQSSPATSFPARPASMMRRSEEGKAQFEAVTFETRDKQVIHAAFYAPRNKGRAPAALLVHDAGSDSKSLAEVAETLQRKGFAVLIPDLRGHGTSVSDTCNWSANKDDQAKMTAWTFTLRDLEASTDFLRNQDTVHNSNLSLVGVGAGSVLAARYAVRDENVRSIALIAPKAEIYGFNILKDINELGGLPVLIMSRQGDRKEASRIQNAATDANGGHEFIDVKVIKPKKENDLFSDKRLGGELSKFLEQEAMPRR